MADLLLREGEQACVRALLASESVPGVGLPGECLLPHLARLLDCDALGIVVLEGDGTVVDQVALLHDRASGRDQVSTGSGSASGGAGVVRNSSPPDAASVAQAIGVLTVGVRSGADGVVRLWLLRRTRTFSDRDRALLRLVAPALERRLREPTTAVPSSLTAQERRVLQLVAAGLGNAEIAERLFVAPATVRKHLEHTYRKLGVTNRLAAVHALGGRGEADLDHVPSIA